jgi:hypothetical protein
MYSREGQPKARAKDEGPQIKYIRIKGLKNPTSAEGHILAVLHLSTTSLC